MNAAAAVDMTPSDEEAEVLALLAAQTYDQVRARTGWSRGRIYALAVRAGARKTEARIRERAADRHARQAEYLRRIVETTATADAVDFLDGIPDASVQLVCTSIPYNLGVRYGDAPSADRMAFAYYRGWCLQIVAELARILRPGGVLFLQLGQTRDWQDRLLPLDVMLFEDLRTTGLIYQSRIAWCVPHGQTPARRLAERFETVLVASQGEPVFNPNAARIPQRDPAKRAFRGPRKGQLSGTPLGAWPTNVWSIPNVGHNNPERRHGAHPAQFPLALAKRAVLLYSMPGDLVCDPFSGSGTTQVATVETGRSFVGADLFYEDVRRARLAAAVPDTSTALTGVTDASVAVWQAEARRVERAAGPWTPAAERQLCMQLVAGDGP